MPPFDKTDREYYINITFPDWMIGENIILRNVIRGVARGFMVLKPTKIFGELRNAGI